MVWRPRWLRPILPTAPGLPASDRCLFIIGAARSGTTVLQNALNEAPEIFVFGEPDFHVDEGEPGFARRYNDMHRAWRNQETKSTFCPPVLPGDGTWQDYLRRLSLDHRYVGAKVVINPVREPDRLQRLFDFQCQNFYRARYLFTFRHPYSTVMSTRELQVFGGGEGSSFRQMLCSYAESASLYVRMVRNLPHVRAVFHEDVDPALFEDLGRWLDLPLGQSHRYYDPGRVHQYDMPNDAAAHRESFDRLAEIYEQLREATRAAFLARQVEQNDGHPDPAGTYFTTLGKADRALRAIVGELGSA